LADYCHCLSLLREKHFHQAPFIPLLFVASCEQPHLIVAESMPWAKLIRPIIELDREVNSFIRFHRKPAFHAHGN
jgi:hypothetical protein